MLKHARHWKQVQLNSASGLIGWLQHPTFVVAISKPPGPKMQQHRLKKAGYEMKANAELGGEGRDGAGRGVEPPKGRKARRILSHNLTRSTYEEMSLSASRCNSLNGSTIRSLAPASHHFVRWLGTDLGTN